MHTELNSLLNFGSVIKTLILVCKINLLERALDLNVEQMQPSGQKRVTGFSCIQDTLSLRARLA